MTLTARVSFRAMSALTLRREKLKLDRRCCSTVALTNASAAVSNTRGSRKVPISAVLDRRSSSPAEWKATLEKKFTDRFLPNTLRRPISKKARGAKSNCSVATPPSAGVDDDAADLDAAAVADRRRRRFLDRDQQIARRLVAVAQLGDARAAEQAERGQPPLALVDRARG